MSNAHSYQQSLFVVPFHIMNLSDLTLGYLKVYEVIFNFWHRKQNCFIGIPALCERTGLQKTHVYDAINYFIKHGELVVKKVKGIKHYFQPSRSLEIREDEDVSATAEKVSATAEKVSATAEHINNKLYAVNNSEAKNFPSSKNDDVIISSTFNQFWEEYPRKVCKKDAFNVWKSKKLYVYAERIISHLKLHKIHEWVGRTKQNIPHPTTYLNGERWNDEITVSTEKRPSSNVKPNQAQQFTDALKSNLERNLREEHPELFNRSSNDDSDPDIVDDNPLLPIPRNLGG